MDHLQKHQDRVAVVTGAAGGLGQVFAERLARDGCDIAIADLVDCRETVRRVEAHGRRALALRCDLAEPDDIQAFVRQVLATLGRVDIVVNNAAYQPMVPFDELTAATLRKMLAVNTEASFLLSQACVPGMRERRWGRIVHLASSSAWSPPPHFVAYIPTKMANVVLTRAMAQALGDDGITVNAIAPGLTRTAAAAEHVPQFVWDRVKEQQLIHRTAQPEDLAGALSFLCSDDASFITGQTYHVDGGAVLA
jgi:3-oxoacyl-[acyl-carrier protein] reductase/(S)-1-phenylethanol dehydrogenase